MMQADPQQRHEQAEAFFAALPCLDPLDAYYPRAVTQIRWGPGYSDYLPRLLTELRKTVDATVNTEDWEDIDRAEAVQFLCLRAIDKVEPRPDRIEECVVRVLRCTDDESVRKLIMRRLRRCRTRPEMCVRDVLRVYRDRRAYIGTRVAAFRTLRHLTGSTVGAFRAMLRGPRDVSHSDANTDEA